MSKTVGIYARVSTLDQHPENQAIELRRIAGARNWTIYEDRVFTDHGISGRKGEDKRPALKEFMDAARRHRFDVVMVWQYSRIARSTQHLLELMNNFRDWNIDFVSVMENVDTTTAMGRLVYTFLAGLAEYELEQTRERVLLGLARARSEGKKLGPPTIATRTKLKPVDPELIRIRLGKMSYREIAAELGVGKSTVERYANAK